MVHTVKRSISPSKDDVHVKRCRREPLSNITNKFTLHQGQLEKKLNDNPSNGEISNESSKLKKKLRYVNSNDRDYYIGVLYTLTCHIGLTQETIHLTISLLDRFLKIQPITLEWLQVVSISCIWIASKFNETQDTIEKLHVKEILQQRQGKGKGNWNWHHVLVLECQILKRLSFRILSPSCLSTFHNQIISEEINLSKNQLYIANYFLDISLMDSRIQTMPIADVVDAVVFLATKFQPNFSFESLDSRIRQPLFRFFLLHLNLQNEIQSIHKAIRCQHNRNLSKPWHYMEITPCTCPICHRSR